MKLFKSKLVAGTLCLVMALSLGACGSNSGDSATSTTPTKAVDDSVIPKELTELTMYSQVANFSGEQIGWAAEILKDKFNVKFNIINEIDGTFATRMAAGNLGDIVIFGSDGDQYMQAVEAGFLFDWEEDNLVQDYGPDIYANMSEALDKNRRISGDMLYGFGYDVGQNKDDHGAFFYYPELRWDLYEKIGKPEINTLEDFIPVLEQMVALEPTNENGNKTYAASLFPDWDGDMVMMVKSTAALYGYDEFGFGLYDTKTQTYEDCLKDGGMYLRCLKFYNTLYQKGLFDPDSMTQNFNDMNEKYVNGAAMFNVFSWMAQPFNSPEHKEAGKVMMPIAAKDQKNIAYGLNVFGNERVWTIGANTNYPELCMTIINYFCTPEGVLTYFYGPKGLTWDYDANGDTYLTELGLTAQQTKDKTPISYGSYNGMYKDGEFQFNNTTWAQDAKNSDSASGESFNYSFWKSTVANKPVTDIEKSWQEFTGYPNEDEYLLGNGHYSLNIGSGFSKGVRDAELEATWVQIKEAIKAGSWSAIYAKTDTEFDSIVAKMVSDVNAYGYDKCVTWCQEQAALRKVAEDKVK